MVAIPNICKNPITVSRFKFMDYKEKKDLCHKISHRLHDFSDCFFHVQNSRTPLVATNQVFMLPTSVAQTVLTDKDIAKSGLSLVPVTLTTSKSSQGQVTLVNPTTIQLISPSLSKVSTDAKTAISGK